MREFGDRTRLLSAHVALNDMVVSLQSSYHTCWQAASPRNTKLAYRNTTDFLSTYLSPGNSQTSTSLFFNTRPAQSPAFLLALYCWYSYLILSSAGGGLGAGLRSNVRNCFPSGARASAFFLSVCSVVATIGMLLRLPVLVRLEVGVEQCFGAQVRFCRDATSKSLDIIVAGGRLLPFTYGVHCSLWLFSSLQRRTTSLRNGGHLYFTLCSAFTRGHHLSARVFVRLRDR